MADGVEYEVAAVAVAAVPAAVVRRVNGAVRAEDAMAVGAEEIRVRVVMASFGDYFVHFGLCLRCANF